MGTARHRPHDPDSPYEKAARAVRNFVQALEQGDAIFDLVPESELNPPLTAQDTPSAEEMLAQILARPSPKGRRRQKARPAPAKRRLTLLRKSQVAWD